MLSLNNKAVVTQGVLQAAANDVQMNTAQLAAVLENVLKCLTAGATAGGVLAAGSMFSGHQSVGSQHARHREQYEKASQLLRELLRNAGLVAAGNLLPTDGICTSEKTSEMPPTALVPPVGG